MEEYRIIKNFKKFIEFMNEGMIKTRLFTAVTVYPPLI